LAEAGAQVIGVLETAHLGVASLGQVGGLGSLWRLVPSLWERRDETWHYLSTLRKHRIPYHFSRAVVLARASAAGQLEAVDVVRLDADGDPMPGSAETWPVDLLCVGHGLVPNIELAQVAGANVVYDAALGGWLVGVDEHSRVRTSIPGLFVAGEAAGIQGASAALLSGRVAGLSAAVHLGRVSQAVLESELSHTAREQRQQTRFATAVNRLFGAPDGLFRAIPDETPICRCEEVTAGQVRSLLAAGTVSTGIRSLDGLKPAVRTGQGLCQGRTCGPILARMLAASTGAPVEEAGLFRTRPPVKPVPVAAIMGILPEEAAR
jgi:NAD(P)H-nitrite reductase large subunit